MANYRLGLDWLRWSLVDRGNSVYQALLAEIVHASVVHDFGDMRTAARQMALLREEKAAVQYAETEGIRRSGLDGVMDSGHLDKAGRKHAQLL